MFNAIWKYLLDSVSTPPVFEDLDTSEGKLSLNEVQEIARKVLKEQRWHSLEPKNMN